MSDQLVKMAEELTKSKAEFDIATTCVAQALQIMCERLDKVELWIESQKNPQSN